MHDEINKIKEKFASVLPESELKKVLKDALKGSWKQPVPSRKAILDDISSKMKEIVASHDKIPLATFKKALIEVWKAEHPDGIAKPARKKSDWHIFMQKHGEAVKQEHPNSSQRERIKILGERYKAATAAQAVVAAPPTNVKNEKESAVVKGAKRAPR